MKLRNRKIITCTQCETTYTIKAFRKLEKTTDGRHTCKSCDFAKGFILGNDYDMNFMFYNADGLDKLLERKIELDIDGVFSMYSLLDLYELFGNDEHVAKAYKFCLNMATLDKQEFELAIEYARQGKSFDTLYDLLVEKHSL
jgi:hypothetical protein